MTPPLTDGRVKVERFFFSGKTSSPNLTMMGLYLGCTVINYEAKNNLPKLEGSGAKKHKKRNFNNHV